MRGIFFLLVATVTLCFALAAHGQGMEGQDKKAGQGVEDLPLPKQPPILEVRGAISRSNADGVAHFDMEMLKALPAARLETTTAVTDGVRRFDGFLMRDLLAHIGAYGTMVTIRALNDYVIDVGIEEFDQFDVLVAYEMDGEPLLPSDKGPLWLVYPRDQHPVLQDIRFDYRWVWQLRWLDIQ